MARALSDYFRPIHQVKALEVYRSFASSAAWSVQIKMDLYVESRKAFGLTMPDAAAFVAFVAFEVIYKNLVSYWQGEQSARRC